MKRTFILGVLVAALAAACTSQPQTPEQRLAAETANAATAKKHCVQDTGSRIKRPPEKTACVQPGRTYSKDELDQTGAATTGEALQRLDPRL